MALHRRFRPVFKKYAPRGTARFAKPLQGPFSLVAKHPQKHKNRPEIGRFSHFNPGAEMHLFSLFSASKSPEKWLYDAICRKKQLFAGSFGSRSHSSCSFTAVFLLNWKRHPILMVAAMYARCFPSLCRCASRYWPLPLSSRSSIHGTSFLWHWYLSVTISIRRSPSA